MADVSTPAATKAVAQTREPLIRPSTARRPEGPRRYAGHGVAYTIGPGVARAATVATYERKSIDPIYRPIKVYTLDPVALALEGATTVLRVPYEPLAPGPRGWVFEVDATDGEASIEPLNLDDPRLLMTQGVSPSSSDRRFHQQMVYAVSASIYAAFRTALGRRIAWGFDRPDRNGVTRLKLRPFVRETGANAAYYPTEGEIRFGYFAAPGNRPAGRHVPGGPVFTCLSHDIIVHEVAHALIDGMRSHFAQPTGSDVLGFHEGFADLVAILQHFTYQQVLESEIRKSRNRLSNATLLPGIAQAFGLSIGKPGVLRSAAQKDVYRADLEPHTMGLVLAGAVFDAFCVVYERKTERFLRLASNGERSSENDQLTPELIPILAREASGLASQFLSICVRALDYCPPVDIKLGEFLRAIITADRDLVPDDPWAYREALIDAFAARGIYPDNVLHLSEDALVWRALPRELPCVRRLSFGGLKFAGDPASPADRGELEEQACALGEVITRPDNLELFGLTADWDDRLDGSRVTLPCIQSIRTSRRVGPDAQVVFDLVAEVTQSRFVRDRRTGMECEFVGGSTIILGPNGEFRYVVLKNVMNRRRLEQQREYQCTSRFCEQRNGHLTPCANVLQLVHGGRLTNSTTI